MQVLRLTVLIADKALKTKQPEKAIKKDLAATLGVSEKSLSHLISSKNGLSITASEMIFLSDYFNITIDELVNPAYREEIVGGGIGVVD